jgi:hypothetical protein
MRRDLRLTLSLLGSSLALAACATSQTPVGSTGFGGASDTASSDASAGNGGDGGSIFGSGGSGGTCMDAKDSDGDGIADSLEPGDTDKDGTPNDKSLDSDSDGYPDELEAANAGLPVGAPGQIRSATCDALADTDNDGIPDVRDPDTDNDGITDVDEHKYDPDGKKGCWRKLDCDGDGVIDIIEVAAGTNPTDAASLPADPAIYFVLPYEGNEQTRDFTFSAGVAKADVYFLVDTTASMQPAIDALKSSLDSKIIPTILNGDPNAVPPIPAISDAYIGVGTFRDVPWSGYGQPGDDIYKNGFTVANQAVSGNVAAPVINGGVASAPASVKSILGSLTAAGGGDGPEATTQALWLASTNKPYAATIGGIWSPAPPYPVSCPEQGMIGVPCFRKDSVPVFAIVTDAAMHNGPTPVNNYDPAKVGGTKLYADAVAAIGGINAKIIGVPVAGGNPGAARADLTDLATKTGSLYHDPAFGGKDVPLVPTMDVTTGEISTQVVRMLGLLAGAGLHDVTTVHTNYDCNGGVDCDGDGKADMAYHNPVIEPDPGPYDASKLITKVATVASSDVPLPYAGLDESTFYGVRGAAKVTFRVHAKNDTLQPPSLFVLRALIRVETPAGQVLGGKNGFKLVYFVIPEYVPYVP